MQDNLSNILNHIYQQKFYFIFFSNFFLFFFEIYCSQLTVDCYCSQLTIDCYCWSQYNRRLAIQFTHCTTKLQYNSLPTAIHLLVTKHLCIAIQFFHCTPLYCNTIFSPLHHHIAIQFSSQHALSCNTILFLQYTYPAYLQASLQYNSLYCNTIFQPNKPSCNTNPCLAIQLPSQQASYCNTIFHPAIQFSSPPKLQYKPSIAIQYPFPSHTALQHYHVTIQCLYCDTISIFQMGSSPKQFNFCTFFFFFSFFIFFFFSLFFFQLFLATGKYQKKILIPKIFSHYSPVHQ